MLDNPFLGVSILMLMNQRARESTVVPTIWFSNEKLSRQSTAGGLCGFGEQFLKLTARTHFIILYHNLERSNLCIFQEELKSVLTRVIQVPVSYSGNKPCLVQPEDRVGGREEFLSDEQTVRVLGEAETKACIHLYMIKEEHQPRMEPGVPTQPGEEYGYCPRILQTNKQPETNPTARTENSCQLCEESLRSPRYNFRLFANPRAFNWKSGNILYLSGPCDLYPVSVWSCFPRCIVVSCKQEK